MSEKKTSEEVGADSLSTPRLSSPLTLKEVTQAFAADGRYGPILSLVEAATIAHRKPSTMKRLTSEGRFRGCVARGKPLLFWRDRFVLSLMANRSMK